MNKEEHKSFLLEIAKNVSKLLASNPANRDRFDQQVEVFCEMRTKFLDALAKCQEAAKTNPKLQCKNEEDKPPEEELELETYDVLEIFPKSESELKDDKSKDFGRDSGVKRTMFWRPPLPFDPKRWLQYCYGYYWREWLGPKPEEPENKNQQLTCQYAVLAVIYDKALGIPVCDRLTDSDPNGWAELLWVDIEAWGPITSQKQEYCAARRDRIQLALDDVAKSQRKPLNLMALTIIPKHFNVSERTLRRKVKDKKLKKYPDEDGTILLDTVEVARRYAPLKR